VCPHRVPVERYALFRGAHIGWLLLHGISPVVAPGGN
jgi:hypothetical protein